MGLVLLTHTSDLSELLVPEELVPAFLAVTNLGSFGVVGFFILSSYLLTSRLIQMRSLSNSRKRVVSAYFVRRIARVWPLYFGVLAFTLLLVPGGGNEATTAQVIGLLTFTYNWGAFFEPFGPLAHFWSIAAEEQLWLLLPVVALLNTRHRRVAGYVLLLGGIVAKTLTLGMPYPAIWNWTTSHLDAFGAGILIASYGFNGNHHRKSPGLLVLGLLPLVLALSAGYGGAIYTSSAHVPVYMLAIAIFSAILVMAIQAASEKPMLKMNSLAWLGQRAFGVYCFHWILIWYGRSSEWYYSSPVLSLILVCAGSFLLAEISYRLVERPAMRWAFHAIKVQD